MKPPFLCALALALTGCVAVPGAGPFTRAAIDDAAVTLSDGETRDPFALVAMDIDLAQRTSAVLTRGRRETQFFEDRAAPAFTLASGDTLAVSIVSVDTNGFLDFSQSAVTPVSNTDLPEQQVGEDGRVQVPPLGRVRAAGITPQALETRLEARLGDVLINPSVVVNVRDRAKARASVLGRVEAAGSYPLLRRDLRLMELLGLAGGPDGLVEDLVLSLSRNGVTHRLPLREVASKPGNNIRVWPGDVVTIEGANRRFVAIGALGAPGEYAFDRPRLTLSNALGLSRGLDDRIAARHGVFVYRLTPNRQFRELGGDASAFGELVPTVYHFDLSEPSMLFAASQFEMADNDVLYVSDSLIAEINKVTGLLFQVVPPPVRFINVD